MDDLFTVILWRGAEDESGSLAVWRYDSGSTGCGWPRYCLVLWTLTLLISLKTNRYKIIIITIIYNITISNNSLLLRRTDGKLTGSHELGHRMVHVFYS